MNKPTNRKIHLFIFLFIPKAVTHAILPPQRESKMNIHFIHSNCFIHFFRIFAADETFSSALMLKQEKKYKMDKEFTYKGNVHQGRNIKRTRLEKNINQDVLSELVHMSQPTVSRIENMRVIEDDVLERFAKALKVPVEYLQTLEEGAQTIVFESITNNDQASSVGYADSMVDSMDNNSVQNINPIDKIAELYERLLKEKDDKYAALEKRIQELEQKLGK